MSSTALQLLTCQTTPVTTVSQILLEAADPATLDTTYNVVKAKKGEESVVRVTTKDAQGNLVGNTAFILTRANSVSRANASATMSVGSLTVTDAWGNTRNNFQSTSETIYGVTGADGSTTLTLKQDNRYRVKNRSHGKTGYVQQRQGNATGGLYRRDQPGFAKSEFLGTYG